jgi:hypothetical protein
MQRCEGMCVDPCVREGTDFLKPPSLAMRLFCDQCGTEFGTAALRPDSKFCSLCGKTLSEYVKQQRNSLFVKSSPNYGKSSKSPGVANTGKKRKVSDEEEEESTSEGVKRKRGRPRKYPLKAANGTGGDIGDVNDETSTEENQESEETEEVTFITEVNLLIF